MTFDRRFAFVARLPDADATEVLLFLRSRGYSVEKLTVKTGLTQTRIEELLAAGICRLVNRMRWPPEQVAKVYRFADLTIHSVLRAAAKRDAANAPSAGVGTTTKSK